MLNRKRLQLLPVFAAVLMVAVLSAPTQAQKRFLDKIRKDYELQKEIGSCLLCHDKKPNEEESRKNLNVFGKAIQSHADMKPILGKDDNYVFNEKELAIFIGIVKKLDAEDHDKDGATNKEEMELRTFPGDAKSIPDKLKLAKYRKEKGTAAPTPPVPAPKTPPKK